MELKTEPFVSGAGDFFDIPAAEQEITVGSNEQTAPPAGVGSTLVQNMPVSISENSYQSIGPSIVRVAGSPQTPRGPRVIMVQRSGQLGSQSSSTQGHGLKTVKIITVPGQGIGGKPIRAAVIPMHMLQRGVKVLTSSGQQTIGPGGTVISSSGMGSPMGFPRLLTLRPASQMAGQASGNVTFLGGPGTSIRPGTLFLSGTPGQGRVTHSFTLPHQMSQHDDMENMLAASVGHDGYPNPGFLDLSAAAGHPGAAHFARQGSPGGPESDGEQDQVTTGLKTNGLRRYARCVCNKVKEKGITSYSEVADELVHEYAAEHPMIPSEQLHYIQKNIRRRVYDALNVLMALNVLQKEKKEIRWVGLPVNMIEECRRLEEEREKRQVSLRNKTAEIQELILQLIAFKNLVTRNRMNERYQRDRKAQREAAVAGTADQPQPTSEATNKSPGSTAAAPSPSVSLEESVAALTAQRLDRINLPFLVVSANKKAVIDCSISKDKLEYLFNFDQPFEIRDEVDTLKRMGLTLRLGSAQCAQEEYNQCLELIPPSLRFYVEAIFERRQAIVPDFEALHQQRRLFVEARLAEVAAATITSSDGVGANAGRTASSNDPHHPHPSAVAAAAAHHRPYGDDFFDDDDDDDDIVSGGVHLGLHQQKQIHLQRAGTSSSGNPTSVGVSEAITPGDTQHYARTAASRGFVVPGGPGGLLRHSAGGAHRHVVGSTAVDSNAGTEASVENATATALIAVGSTGRQLFDVGADESDVDLGEEDDDEEEEDIEDDDDDADMEDVQEHR